MTKLMEKIIDLLRQVPETAQDEVAGDVAEILEEFATPEELEAIARGRAEYKRGEFTTLKDLEHDLEGGSR